MLKDKMASCCKALKLSRNLVENRVKIEDESHEEYLLKLLRLELEHRDANRKDRLFKNAGFYTIKTFADYIFDKIKLPQGLTPQDLKDCKISRRKEKPDPLRQCRNQQNHLATAIGVEVCKKGHSVKFSALSAGKPAGGSQEEGV